MSNVPDGVDVPRNRDVEGRKNLIWVRRALFALLPFVMVLALLNVFGQHPQTASASSGDATLTVKAPERMRAGLLGDAVITVSARRALRHPVLLLDDGWFSGLSVSSIQPTPEKEESDGTHIRLELGPLAAGASHVLYLDFQVNPTNVGRFSRSVELVDGDRSVARVDRELIVFP